MKCFSAHTTTSEFAVKSYQDSELNVKFKVKNILKIYSNNLCFIYNFEK